MESKKRSISAAQVWYCPGKDIWLDNRLKTYISYCDEYQRTLFQLQPSFIKANGSSAHIFRLKKGGGGLGFYRYTPLKFNGLLPKIEGIPII